MREILHCDFNNFFASVECLKNPELREVPMAVCGDPELRHGIILAKNEKAKKFGIVTAETIYSAKKKCKNLVLVQGDYKDYIKYSRLANEIYLKYTDRVEKFGIDESFLDVTESKNIFGSGEEIANIIKDEIKNTLDLTISVGVSFNKALAKLGSDLGKANTVTVLSRDNFKKTIFPLPVNNILYVGKSTYNQLKKLGINTIGELANYDIDKLIKKLGKIAKTVHDFANGRDQDIVPIYSDVRLAKSISKGLTFSKDLELLEDMEKEVRILSDYVAYMLRKQKLVATVVSVSIKSSDFNTINRQKQIVQSNYYKDILEAAIYLLVQNYKFCNKVRAITVSVSNLENQDKIVEQLNIFDIVDTKKSTNSYRQLNEIMDSMRDKYGADKITFASLKEKNR